MAVRDRLEGDLGAMPLAAAIEKLQAEIRAKTVRKMAKTVGLGWDWAVGRLHWHREPTD